MSTGAPDQSILSHIDGVEAKLDAVRLLHQPRRTGMYRIEAGVKRPVIECQACLEDVDDREGRMWTDWPCPTAELVYSPDEISKIKAVTDTLR